MEAEGNDEDAATPMEALKLNADERQKEYDVSLPEDVSTSVTKQGGLDLLPTLVLTSKMQSKGWAVVSAWFMDQAVVLSRSCEHDRKGCSP